MKDLIHRHQALLFVFTYHELLRLAQINGGSVILICQKGQKYCRDLRGKIREGFDPQTSSPTLCIYVSRIAEISTNKRRFSNIDLPERAKVLPRLKGKNT